MDPCGRSSLTGLGGFGSNRRCEINSRRFERGTLGLYQENRDGGGTQLIFTKRPIPEFDGRYTVFGHVVKGLEALDSLGEGDRILKVELLSSP